MTKPTTIAALTGILISACDGLATDTTICYYQGDALSRMVVELDREGISHAPSSDPNCVIVSDLSAQKNEELSERVLGRALPEGRHIGWPIEAYATIRGETRRIDESGRILQRIEEEGLQVEFISYAGRDFLVWEDADDAAIQKIINNN
jgi:hypothetical protein